MTDRLAGLAAAGVAVWLDDISRQRLSTGVPSAGEPVDGLETGNLDALRRKQAQEDLDALASLGVDYQDVVEKLERDGVASFEQSWLTLLGSVRTQLDGAAG